MKERYLLLGARCARQAIQLHWHIDGIWDDLIRACIALSREAAA
jgi:hypothetical protein